VNEANRTGHLGDDDIVFFLDGELPSHEAERVRKHLSACWACRTAAAETEAAVLEFVRLQERVLASERPPRPWKDINAEIAALEAREQTSGSGAGRSWFRRFSPAWGACAMAIAALSVVPERRPAVLNEAPRSESPLKPGDSAVQPLGGVPAPGIRAPEMRAQPGPMEELRVVEILHEIGADLGEPVEVVRERERIAVRGHGLTGQRREIIVAALAGLPFVKTEFPGAQSALNAAGGTGPPPVETDPAHQDRRTTAEIDRSNEIVDLSDSLMARVSAVRNLDVRFAGPPALPPDGQLRIATIQENHLREARKTWAQLKSVLERANWTNLGPGPRELALPDAVVEFDRLVNFLFAPSENGAAADPAAIMRLRQLIGLLDEALGQR
jgi:hypothetical protein